MVRYKHQSKFLLSHLTPCIAISNPLHYKNIPLLFIGEEARRQLHKNVASNIEQVLAATPPQGTNYMATCLPS